VKSNKPWALLLPNYVATKSYYAETLLKSSSSSGNKPQPFFVVPTLKQGSVIETYQFAHPEGTGHAVSPFDSFWIVDTFSQQYAKNSGSGSSTASSVVKSLKNSMMAKAGEASSERGTSMIVESVDELKRLKLVPTAKRLNPKQRKKLAAKRGAF
jgi:hypothetical protein